VVKTSLRGGAAALAVLAGLASAGAQPADPDQQPYAGLQTRALKALSEQQIADLRAGRGMGLALAAELNGYPGPVHVLEHADALGLSATQRARTQALFEAMRAEAVALGERLIREEADLERLFATRTVQPATLDGATAAIAATQGRLRAAHLRYHLAMAELLTPGQVRRYADLRGYGASGPGGHGHGGSHAK
jgi:Spy/CpxP family protein refolding chaperone